MKNFKLVFLFVLFYQLSIGQTLQDTISQVDKILSQYKATNPGCQLSIERNGKIIYSTAMGLADLEHNVPLTTNSIIEAGSVSKQFTAAALLLLEQQGKLSLNDDVRKYIPELSDYGMPIKLSHMIHHTSGLRDWGSIASLTGWSRGTQFYTNEDALEIIVRQKELNNKPGDEFIYSNSNYNLAAIIVQRVSGLTLADFTKKYIFDPAGMTNTQWRDDPNRIVKNRAIAYSKTETGYKLNMPNEYVYGNGGLLTTTEDLLKWSNFYQQGKMGTSSLLAKQLQTESLNNGKKNGYGAGLFIMKVRGWDNISHGGATAGYRAYLETFPELKLTIAILSNTSEFNINTLASSVNKIFVTDKTDNTAIPDKPKEEPKIEPILISPEALKTYEGIYFSEETNSTVTIKVQEEKLMIRLNANTTYSLKRTTKDTFHIEELDGDLVFFKTTMNKLNSFKISIGRARNVAFTKKE
jgi:CubicO group peptidase (beta-lactamase class C family)